MRLHKIFCPHDARKMAEHATKFEALPLTEPVITAQYPEFDGDMAELYELAERIFAELARIDDIAVTQALVTDA